MNKEYEKPDVSVWMTTYYNENYVAQAIESILAQKTTYSYEIVIGDDCSQDGTWNVILSYMEKYPDIIRAKHNEVNLGLSKNILGTKMRCQGRYIINLSGDDYWLDMEKIQKQAEFLEKNVEYVGVGTRVEVRYENLTHASSYFPIIKALNNDYTLRSFEQGILMPSHGFMIRNIFADPEKREYIEKAYSISATIDDVYDPVLFLQFGKIFIMNDITCVHRIQVQKQEKHNFNSNHTPFSKSELLLDGFNKMEEMKYNDLDLTNRYVSVMNLAILSSLKAGKISPIKKLYSNIPERYRKPWYRSVALGCAKTIINSAYRYAHNRFKMKKAIREIREIQHEN